MAFTNAQQQLLNAKFSTANQAHMALLTEKLASFNGHFSALKAKSRPIAISAMGAFATRLIGFGTVFFIPVDLILWSYGAYEVHNSVELNHHYRADFADLLKIYDWCIPDKDNLPATNIAAIQNLIETMGTLVNSNRLQRLQPLINGQQDANDYGAYAKSFGWAALGAASNLIGFGGGVQDPQNIMNPATFTLLVRNLVNGNSTSMSDYVLYGEGSTVLANGLNRGVNTAIAVKDVIKELIPKAGGQDDNHPNAL